MVNNIFSQRLSVFYSQDFYHYKFNDVIINGYMTEHQYTNKLNFASGILFELNKSIDYYGQISYATKGYRLKYHYITYSPDPVALPDYCDIISDYLDISVGLGKTIHLKSKLDFKPYFLFSTSVLFKDGAKIITTDGSETYSSGTSYCIVPQNLEKFLYHSSAKIMLTYSINKRFSVFIQPGFAYYFKKIEQQTIKNNPIEWNLLIGLTLKIKKDEN